MLTRWRLGRSIGDLCGLYKHLIPLCHCTAISSRSRKVRVERVASLECWLAATNDCLVKA